MATDMVDLREVAMRRALGRARLAIPEIGKMDGELAGRLETRFTELAKQVEEDLGNGGTAASKADALRRGEELVAETLAVAGGAAARKLGLDGGLTALALAWLDHLSSKASLEEVGVVIPASTEFTGMLTQVVRLRLPTDGVWSMPVAVHEYGHFVASVLTARVRRDALPVTVAPVEELLNRTGAERELPLLYWHGHELFADIVATAVCGPAYTRYCLRYRFDPAAAQEVTPTHPSPARRIRLQLAVLDELVAADASGYLAAEARELRDAWGDVAVTADPVLDDVEPKLRAIVREHDKLRPLRYRDHLQARTLKERFAAGAVGDATVAHVLNAAWLVRAGLPEDDDDQHGALEQRTEQLIREALGHG